MDYEINSTEIFDKWIENLQDRLARILILKRIDRARKGNFGDYKPVTGEGSHGLHEMRLDYGPGYRLYYGQSGRRIFILITGGLKKSQRHDISTAKALWKQIKEQGHDQKN